MTLKEILSSKFPPYFLYGKVLASQNASFRLEHSLHKDDKIYVAWDALDKICQEREEVLEMLEKLANELKQSSRLGLELIFDQKIED